MAVRHGSGITPWLTARSADMDHLKNKHLSLACDVHRKRGQRSGWCSEETIRCISKQAHSVWSFHWCWGGASAVQAGNTELDTEVRERYEHQENFNDKFYGTNPTNGSASDDYLLSRIRNPCGNAVAVAKSFVPTQKKETYMNHSLFILALGCLTAAPALADSNALPSNLLYDASKAKKTIWPQPVKNSGELKYNEHTRKPEKGELKGPLNGNAENGKKLAMNTQRGNCWACHAMPGDPQPGNGGPPFMNIGTWGYSDAYMYQQIWDRSATNPATEMPPFGTNGVLSDQDVRDIVAFLQSLK